MSLETLQDSQTSEHPIDVMESLATAHKWPCERGETQNDMNVCIKGHYCDFHIAVNWRPDLHGLHLACVLDIRILENKRADICTLLALINEQLFLGHFDLWSVDGTILFRNTIMVSGMGLSEMQCFELINNATETCERFFPAFQYMLWANQSAQDALNTCMFETKGEA